MPELRMGWIFHCLLIDFTMSQIKIGVRVRWWWAKTNVGRLSHFLKLYVSLVTPALKRKPYHETKTEAQQKCLTVCTNCTLYTFKCFRQPWLINKNRKHKEWLLQEKGLQKRSNAIQICISGKQMYNYSMQFLLHLYVWNQIKM